MFDHVKFGVSDLAARVRDDGVPGLRPQDNATCHAAFVIRLNIARAFRHHPDPCRT